MIAKILHIQSKSEFQNKIDYNEKKVEKGVAEVIFNNTYSKNKTDRLDTFMEVISLNKNVRNNLAFEVSLNLPPGESLSNDDFQNLMNDYLKGIGYDNVPVLAYKHFDSGHNHLHLLVSHVDWDGKKINQFNLFLKSQNVSRELEVKHNIRQTEYDFKVTNESLSSKLCRKYYIQNALKKGLKAYNTKEYLTSLFTPDELKTITKRNVENEQMNILLRRKKIDIIQYLEKHKLFNKQFKDELYVKVESVYNLHKDNPTAFVKGLKEEGVYVRKVYDKGKPNFVYGISDVSFYINDNKLARKFAYSAIVSGLVVDENKSFDRYEQEKYLMIMVPKSLYKAKNLNAFSEDLKENGVELITYQNSGGIYGVAFKSIDIDSAEIIKGSDIGVSWNDIKEMLDDNNKIIIDNKYDNDDKIELEEFDYLPHVPEKNLHNHKDEEDYQTIRKKYGKKSRGMSR